VLVSPDASNAAGGVERMCVLLAGVLERSGWRSTIVGPDHEVTRWQFRLALGPVARSRSAARALGVQHPDLLITNGYMGVGYSASRRARGTSVGAVRAVGKTVARRERTRHLIGHAAAEALSRRGTTATVCVSSSAAWEARRFYRVRDARVIANGIDTAVFSPRPREQARRQLGLAKEGRYALFVGRMDEGKGARLLPAACERAGYELVVAGRDTGAGAVNLGVLPPEQLAVAYSAADCVLFPSLYEACSYVVLEALACGVPLITTRVGWMPTLLAAVPEYEELCVEPVLEQLVERLRSLEQIETEPLRTAARTFVLENNSLDAYAASWQELLDRYVG
jgi:glycosyltransferase involved in cell wall biosynthesis